MNKICMIIRLQQPHYSARTGTLKLTIERRHTDGHTYCEICNTNAKIDITLSSRLCNTYFY